MYWPCTTCTCYMYMLHVHIHVHVPRPARYRVHTQHTNYKSLHIYRSYGDSQSHESQHSALSADSAHTRARAHIAEDASINNALMAPHESTRHGWCHKSSPTATPNSKIPPRVHCAFPDQIYRAPAGAHVNKLHGRLAGSAHCATTLSSTAIRPPGGSSATSIVVRVGGVASAPNAAVYLGRIW